MENKPEHKRIRREKNTIDAMIGIYCADHHQLSGELCSDCSGLCEYAHMRLDRCRYQHKKPICGNCPVHCYKPSMKERVVDVMSYSGPRMALRHPYYALIHVIDGFRKVARKKAMPDK